MKNKLKQSIRKWKQYIPVKWIIYYKYYIQPYHELSDSMGRYIFMDCVKYENSGDDAIGLSTIDFMKKNVSEDITVLFVRDFFANLKALKKKIKDTDVIILQGGGNIGVQYFGFERIREMVCLLFPNNRIIVFPQTMDFGDLTNAYNKRKLLDAVKVYSQHQHLTICARERFSYELMKKYFSDNRILLVPDMVLRYVPEISKKAGKDTALFCFRSDCEKAITEEDVNGLEKLMDESGYRTKYIDTWNAGVTIGSEQESAAYVNRIINEFASAEIAFTDRLHGMVFAYLSQTPCIVFSNYNHKVKGVYEWIKDCGFIFFADNYREAWSIWKRIADGSIKLERKRVISDLDYRELIEVLK